MDAKSELLVFNKREISVILTLLVLVALFSFTLGLRLGKALSQEKQTEHAIEHHDDRSQLAHSSGDEHAPVSVEDHQAESTQEHNGDHDKDHSKDQGKESLTPEEAQAKVLKLQQKAEDQADEELVHESGKEKVSAGKAVPMTLPKEKKADSGVRYTLQVGSHRTVAEAAEQVSELKRNNIDAFYLEAKVPGKGTWYRVAVGSYPSKESAERSATKLKPTLPPFIIQKINE